MNDQSMIEKIRKFGSKGKSGKIIKLMESRHADQAVICAGLEELAKIKDEDSVNIITHHLDHENPVIRLTACIQGIAVGSEYMKSRVQYQLSVEQDAEVKGKIQQAFNEKYN